MYFDDEKDIIGENPELQIDDDGSVSWENILSDSDDGITVDENGEVTTNIPGIDDSPSGTASVQDDSLNYGDELEFIQNDNEVNEQNINYSIDDSTSADSAPDLGLGDNIEDASSNAAEADEFDIDKQLEQISLDGASGKDESKNFKMPEKKAKNSSSMPILLALLLALLVMGGLYYYFNFFSEGEDDLVPPSTQTQMNNTTQEDIAQRTEEAENIPVVNEDNVDTLKPEEVPAEEKKEVIDIKPTGRLNPFLPLQKYVKADIPETFVQYDKVGIPTPPKQIAVQDEETTKMLSIAVSGIMYDEQKPSAIISLENNDYFVQKGDKLDDYNVVDIGKNYVTISHGKNYYKANVGEEFKITSNFYGSAQYIPQKQGGGRHYYTVSEQRASEMNNARGKRLNDMNGRRYVSEDEVLIKSR